MKGIDRFITPYFSNVTYVMNNDGSTRACWRKIYIFGIRVAAYDIFLPD